MGRWGMVNVGLSMSVALLVHSTAASAGLLAKEVIEPKSKTSPRSVLVA